MAAVTVVRARTAAALEVLPVGVIASTAAVGVAVEVPVVPAVPRVPVPPP